MKKAVFFLLACVVSAQAQVQAQVQAQGEDQWRPVEMREPSQQERGIVESVYGGFLGRESGVRVEVARVDVNGDRVAELVVRLVHPSVCDQGNRCYLGLLRSSVSRGVQAWVPILERSARTFETGAMSRGVPSFLRVRIDGREVWEVAPNGRYVAQISSFGAPVEMRPNPPASVLREVARMVASDLGMRVEPREVVNGTFFGTVDLGQSGRFLVAQTSAMGVCGQVGCPALVMSVDGQNRVIGRFGALEGAIHVGRWPNGEALVAAGSPEGVVLYAISGGRLVLRDTTFAMEARQLQ